MKPSLGVLAVVVLAALANVPSFAQLPESAGELLQRVAETYRNLESFEWAAVSIITTDSGDFQPRPSTFKGEFRRPKRMRIEWLEHTPIPEIEVTDGATVWLYYPSRRGFCRPDPKRFVQRTPHEAMFALGWSLPYEHITDGLRSARIVGNRRLKIGDESVNCRVVTATYAPAQSAWTGTIQAAPITYWIDPRTNIVVQQIYQRTFKVPGRDRLRRDTTTRTLVRYRLNPKIEDARFTFQRPQGVTEESCRSFLSGGGVN